MKKLIIMTAIAALAFSTVARAELEISGNVTTMAAYQHDDQDAANTIDNVTLTGGTGGLTQGDLIWTPTANADHFGFLVDQAEIDVENEFGENIRARVDLDFIDLSQPSNSALLLEQAYVTANLGLGNGMEFLIGKFNMPFGLESVDRHSNVFSTYTPGYLFLAPRQVLGSKVYYDFNDNWNMDIAVVNSMNALAGNSAYPSGLLRVGANWGAEGRESYWHIAAGFGPEYSTGNACATCPAVSQNKHYDALVGTWANFALGDYWDLGVEVSGRQSDSATGVGANQKAVGGQLYAAYQASDVWALQARGAAFWELNPSQARLGSGASTTGGTWSGHEGMIYSGTLGATYKITDDAQMKLEYRFDYASVSDSDASRGSSANADFHTGVAEFGYSF